jgi:DNA-binding beta-propeller fold protein YncE
MIKPYGVTVDSEGRLIVVDTPFKRVHIFDIRNQKYQFINDLDSTRLVSPIAAAVDSQDNIYVTDSVAGKVFVYNKGGGYLFDFDAGKRPTGIAINKETRRLYVVDTASHMVKIFDLDGEELKSFGGHGPALAQFNLPVDIFLDRSGDVYVTDTMNYRIKIFDPDGKFLTSFGTQGDGGGDFGRPKGVAVDGDGNIYVADAIYDTVQIFDRKGRFLLNFGTLGNARGAFWMPAGLFIDEGDRIYVADSYNRRVQVFEYLGDSSLDY